MKEPFQNKHHAIVLFCFHGSIFSSAATFSPKRMALQTQLFLEGKLSVLFCLTLSFFPSLRTRLQTGSQVSGDRLQIRFRLQLSRWKGICKQVDHLFFYSLTTPKLSGFIRTHLSQLVNPFASDSLGLSRRMPGFTQTSWLSLFPGRTIGHVPWIPPPSSHTAPWKLVFHSNSQSISGDVLTIFLPSSC